jgi:uncharacterized protein (TIGR02466 family)
MNISPLFPRPVGLETVNFISTQDRDHLLSYQTKLRPNYGNRITENTYVLEDKELTNLKQNLESALNNFFYEVYKAKQCKLYITQSWLNFAEKEEFHHRHWHPNSFMSGVLYLQTIPDDKIVFTSNLEHLNVFEFDSEEFTLFNSNTWWMPVEDNSLIFFPSNMNHEVNKNNSSTTRISLAFNSYIKGSIGNSPDLKKLNL